MKKSILKSIGIIAVVVMSLTSCSSSDDDNGGGGNANQRNVKFEVTGNFTGDLSATFIVASGGAVSEDLPSLPWIKEITYEPSVSGTGISVGGTGGVAGQTLTVKIFSGGTLISTTPATANNNGTVTISAPSYIFQ
ncbi:hypothetical protein [Flavobacterium sp. '19STA2R22 D10 B1']|uniref:hypothetical protein n=1 Tax=Flavobacterium aerium TaxID=3037261 RepID=UPI00278BCD0F|nr:hypothetical protein [Flavobacterium sp. '19STA2R22 D10 B1']